ncbi:unnamed protein product [Moneuplotes crassus]|uniref:Uncharacterized protein n=1 Tax=Euplotes crassus TaxID=5936 RepID=A0AAD1Y139_EUPCR|nr:unnamed protein product [Moneuplotes crassus]
MEDYGYLANLKQQRISFHKDIAPVNMKDETIRTVKDLLTEDFTMSHNLLTGNEASFIQIETNNYSVDLSEYDSSTLKDLSELLPH